MSRVFLSILSFVLAVNVAACSDPVGPEDLEFSLSVTPTTVEQHDSFQAVLVIHNPRVKPVTLVSGCAALALARLYHDGEWVDARGSGSGCIDVISRFEVPRAGQLRQEWLFFAETSDGVPLPPGIYSVRLEFQVKELSDLEHELVVE